MERWKLQKDEEEDVGSYWMTLRTGEEALDRTMWRHRFGGGFGYVVRQNTEWCFWVCACSPIYPARIAHAPYCHLWPIWLYRVFPHYLVNGTIFEKKSLNTKCVFWFSVQLLSETFLILRRTERDMIKNIHWSLCKVPVIGVRY